MQSGLDKDNPLGAIRPRDDEKLYIVDDDDTQEISEESNSEEESDNSEDDANVDSDEADEIYSLAKPLLEDNMEIENPKILAAIQKIEEKQNSKRNKESQMSRIQKFCFRFSQSCGLTWFIAAIVVINIITIFLQTFENINTKASYYFTAFDQICLAIYIGEMLVKLVGLRIEYFMDKFNILDFIIILISFVDYADAALPVVVSINASSLRAFRVFRAIKGFKLLRSVQAVRPIVVLLKSINDSLVDCVASMVLLLLIMYFYAFMGLTFYKEVSPANFGDFFRAFFSMFQLCTFDDWFDMYDSVKSIPEGHILFFITFMLLCSFIVLNYVTAVLTDKACDAAVRVSNTASWMSKEIRRYRELKDNLQAKENTDQSSASQVEIRKHYEESSRNRVQNISEILSLLSAIERSKMISDGHAAVLGELIDAALEYEQAI